MAIALVAIAVLAWLIVGPSFASRRRREALARPLPEDFVVHIERNVPARRRMPAQLQARHDSLVSAFLAEKQFIGCNGLVVTDEVRATIAAARLGGGQVRVVFQPHRHTRTADCFAAFTGAFDQAHRVAFLPIYGAGEDPIPGVTSEALAESIIRRREADPDPGVLATCDRGAALAHALSGAQPGDTLLLLGAGDVGHLAQDALHASVHR